MCLLWPNCQARREDQIIHCIKKATLCTHFRFDMHLYKSSHTMACECVFLLFKNSSVSQLWRRKTSPSPQFIFIQQNSLSVLKDGFARQRQIHGCLMHLFSQTIPMPVSAFQALCCLFPSHFLLLCSDTPGSAADGAWPVGVGRQPALARNFQFQLDLTEGGSHYPYTEVGSEKNTPAVS